MATVMPVQFAGDMNPDQVAQYLGTLKLDKEAHVAKKAGISGHDLEFMSTDEIASTLGCSTAAAKTIKADLKAKMNAQPDSDDDDDVSEPHTPLGSEASIVFDMAGDVPRVGKGYAQLASFHVTGDVGGVSIDSDTLNKYVTAVGTIERIEACGTELQLPAEEQKLKSFNDVVRCKTTERDDLVKSVKYAESKLKMAGKGGIMGKIVHGSASGPSDQQKQDVVDAAQAQYDFVTKKLEACEKVLDDSKRAAADQEVVVKGMQAEVVELAAARKFDADVTATLFKGSAGSAEENALEGAVDTVIPQLESMRQRKATFLEVEEMLKSVLKKLEQAEDKWDNARHVGRWDKLWRKVTGSKGNVVLDLNKVSHCQAGINMARSAMLDLAQAKEALPDLPNLDPAKITSLKEGGFKDAYLDPTLAEKQHSKDLKNNIKELRAIEKATAGAQKWLTKWLTTRIDKDLATLEADCTTKRNALTKVRRELMKKELAARGISINTPAKATMV